MDYPMLKNPATTQSTLTVFGGLDRNTRRGEGQFYHMHNMSSRHYPALGPRAGRSIHLQGADLGGIIAKDCLCRVENGDFVMNDYRVAMKLTPGNKNMVSMGAYVVIFPDKKYVNTLDLTDFGDLEAEFVSQSDVTFTLCDQSGAAYAGYTVAVSQPENPENGDYWLDISGSPASLKVYSDQSCVWTPIAATYVKISCPGIGKAFSRYDGVRISGILPEALADLNGELVLWDRGEDWLLVAGILENPVTQAHADGAVTVSRRLPEMDFVIEAGNRLWGCRYGTDRAGNIVNEIYASKLGDFKNFSCYMGLSTDSYTASVGTDGPFTGAVTHLGYPLFFKENHLHKVYGSYPATYRVQATVCPGVRAGCQKSLAMAGSTLYYCGTDGVYGYDGSLPTKISQPLGDMQLFHAVAGTHGGRYYLSAADGEGGQHLLVYDTARRLWHREDDLLVQGFAHCSEGFFALCGDKIYDLSQGQEQVVWSAQTGPLGLDSPERGYICRLTARLNLAPGSSISVFVRYDGAGQWEHLATVQGKGRRTFDLPLRTKRCDHMELKFSGTGKALVYSLTKTCQKGSETP